MILGYIRVSTDKQDNSKQKHLIQELNDRDIKLIFIRQPELSTFNTAHAKLLLAIYSYFAESEREFISLRTKQGLAAARASGKILGRPVGKKGISKFDKHHETMKALLLKDVSMMAISKIIGDGSYMGIRNYIVQNKELNKILKQNKESLLAQVS